MQGERRIKYSHMIFRGGGTVVILFKLSAKKLFEMELTMDEMDLETEE